MWISVYIIIFFVLMILVGAQNSCVNPMGFRGICIDVEYCQHIYVEQHSFHEIIAELFFQASICGFENNATKVCCPHTWLNPINSNPTRRPDEIMRRRYGPIYSPDCGTTFAYGLRIVGGRNAPLGAWPWMVALGYQIGHNSKHLNWSCGGSLISTRHVLSAAHCMYVEGFGSPTVVRLGDLDLDERVTDGAKPMNVKVDLVHVHPGYRHHNNSNDIAVIRIIMDVKFTNLIRPICLPLPQEVFTANHVRSRAWVTGWGNVQVGGPSTSRLKNAQILVLNTSLCVQRYSSPRYPVFEDQIICAGYPSGGRDTCQGDSGGPLMTRRGRTFYVIGVVSYGYKCALPGVPGVYTKTTAYLKWIISKLY